MPAPEHASVYPSWLPPADVGTAIHSPRGVLMVVVHLVGAAEPASQNLIAEIVKTYAEIPPDVDRLVALRATLDQARQVGNGLLPSDSNEAVNSSVAIAALSQGQWYAAKAGKGRGYHVQANGRIDQVKLEPAAQRAVAPEDSVLLCSASLSDALDEYEIALALYSRSPQSAVGHLLEQAKRKGARGAVSAVVLGPQRSVREGVFGRSASR